MNPLKFILRQRDRQGGVLRHSLSSTEALDEEDLEHFKEILRKDGYRVSQLEFRFDSEYTINAFEASHRVLRSRIRWQASLRQLWNLRPAGSRMVRGSFVALTKVAHPELADEADGFWEQFREYGRVRKGLTLFKLVWSILWRIGERLLVLAGLLDKLMSWIRSA